jgi:predicted DNA-binding transcriptional regulator AlpA
MRKILRKPIVADIVGLSGRQIDRLESSNNFPRRVIITPGAVGWYDDEIEQYVESRQRGLQPAPKEATEARRRKAESRRSA